ncbi:phosphodiesterase [Paraurantiacibacter namhicola]|uniref:3',5'-cyclic adenosine monophosphate phosphodiesterase CpdA n=1 Tax=Paraurantiacibacter namhicola TaxID=645517 RepID=A0A1C7DBF2_9SPHN|nr:phosphodiesterase [Paraurantiacibacter namhicola]ANU08712.1 3',5'-cyclic adenosine monophosphate phosphodiesterase CpdA [Paraurantiacibacter namhicola]
MLIAQITDTHLTPARDADGQGNAARLARVLEALLEGPNRPDLLLVTGDLTDKGSEAAQALLAKALADVPFPALLAAGNHDDRITLVAQHEAMQLTGGFLQYAHDAGGLRVIVLDTVSEGLHGGAFCEARAQWLREQLSQAGDTPVLLAMHHPPVTTGIEWMDAEGEHGWRSRFADVVEQAGNVVGIVCGHVHRPIQSTLRGVPVTVCPSVSSPLSLDLTAIDTGVPDGRVLVHTGPPAYALHHWDGQQLTTHFAQAVDSEPLYSLTDESAAEVERIRRGR